MQVLSLTAPGTQGEFLPLSQYIDERLLSDIQVKVIRHQLKN